MTTDPYVELAREIARRAVQRSSLRRVAEDIGISHVSLREFVANDSKRMPYGESRAKLLNWSDRQERADSPAASLAYYQGMQDVLTGLLAYVGERQAEIRRFREELRTASPVPRTPEEISRAFDEGEAEAALLAQVQRQRPEPKPKPQGKKRRA